MKSSRRTFVTAGLGSTLVSCAKKPPVEPAAEKPAAKLELLDFQPKSMLVVPEHPVPRAKYPVIDVHTHLSGVFGRQRAPEAGGPTAESAEFLKQIVQWMDELNLKLIVNLTGGSGELLKRNIAWLDGKYPGRFRNCVTPDYSKFKDPDYPKWQADDLARAKEAGAIGLKITKFLGLNLRENIKEGPLVKIDDPRFDPMWEAAGKLGLPVFIHTANPDAFFTPIDQYNERWEELGNHPNWSFYGKDFPPKADLLAARNRVIERHPKTTFVGLHVANRPENLDEVSAWLDKYPNLHCEVGARLGELGRQPRRSVQFFQKYQDRIMYGTDASPYGKEVPQQDLKPPMFQAYFRFFETLDEYFDYAPSPIPPQGRWRIYGIGLPDAILKKVYHNNAARLLGMKLV